MKRLKWRIYWELFGFRGLFWRLCKIMGVRHAYRQMMSGRK